MVSWYADAISRGLHLSRLGMGVYTCAYAASALYKREKRKDGEKERELETKKEREIGRGGGMTRNDARGKRVPFINAYQRSVSVM